MQQKSAEGGSYSQGGKCSSGGCMYGVVASCTPLGFRPEGVKFTNRPCIQFLDERLPPWLCDLPSADFYSRRCSISCSKGYNDFCNKVRNSLLCICGAICWILPNSYTTSYCKASDMQKDKKGQEDMAPALLVYWNIRGLGHPIRLLLEYTGTEYEEKYHEVGPGPEFDRTPWFNVKYKLGLDFPNLPYFIDGQVKMTHTLAIMRYIARKHGLCGSTEEERIKIELVEQETDDLRFKFYLVAYNKDFEKLKDDLIERSRRNMKDLSKFLGDNDWFSGGSISYADFLVFDLIGVLLHLDKDVIAEEPRLQNFMKRIENLEPIKKYLASSRCILTPLCNKNATFY